jgi:hypothetical protein
VEGFVGGDPRATDQDADGLIDHRPGGQRRLQVRREALDSGSCAGTGVSGS